MRKNKYLIIGAAGFIGSNVSEYLIKRNIDCLLVDNLSYGSSLSFYIAQLCYRLSPSSKDEK